MATIHDVARDSGVSISTVSRVIQGAHNVLPQTRAKVEDSILRLDYHPNRLAQQFRTQQTNMILVIIPELGNPFFADILAGIESIITPRGYTALLINSHSDASAEQKCYDMLSQKLADGIITFSIGIAKEKLKQFAAQYPVVIGCRYFADNSIANVTIDNIKATKDITSYLLNLGHRKILYLAGPEHIPLYQDRIVGYYEALTQRGLPCDPDLVVHCPSDVDGGYQAISSLIDGAGSRYTAVAASGDSIAMGVIRALNDHHLKVPDDIAVTGFDDLRFSALSQPSLTTVRQPKFQIGAHAAEKLLELIAGNPLINARDVLKHELVIRESSGGLIS
jgi:LacI family repressor for deo operon, udp, cdd, tsx, nupC, and nupG